MARSTRRPRLRREDLPDAGAAFLMPLDDGRFGVCRVLRRPDAEEEARHGAPTVLAAASSWIGDEPPAIDDPRLRAVLILSHHAFAGRPEIQWVSERVPESFRPLGTIEPDDDERRMPCNVHGGWGSFPLQRLLQWRWDHDREAVAREDDAKKAAVAAANKDAPARRMAYLDGLTLAGLRKKRRLVGWRDGAPAAAIRACRAAFAEAIDALDALGPAASRPARLRVLKRCVESLNRIDDAHGHFIETAAREELGEEIDEIAHVAGFRGVHDLAGRWRDW
ncbi:hypothetical protein [Aquisphaera giovannonii]|nr:hypothetical protein [Aquisphaera giovannonii]